MSLAVNPSGSNRCRKSSVKQVRHGEEVREVEEPMSRKYAECNRRCKIPLIIVLELKMAKSWGFSRQGMASHPLLQ
jgi:hypothetical protein